MRYNALTKEDRENIANETLRMLEREHFQLEVQLAGLDPNNPPAEGFSSDVQYQLRRRDELVDKIKATAGVVKEMTEPSKKKTAAKSETIKES